MPATINLQLPYRAVYNSNGILVMDPHHALRTVTIQEYNGLDQMVRSNQEQLLRLLDLLQVLSLMLLNPPKVSPGLSPMSLTR
jgi:hypothetical protein